MTDLGRIEPMYGRWYWPFRAMEVGDEFHVRFQDRAPEEVRHMATVRAAQIGIRLRTRKDDEAGVMRVERIAMDLDNAKVLAKALEYEQVRALFRDSYGLDADSFPWWKAVDPGEEFAVDVRRLDDDPRKLVLAKVGDERYAVELGATRIVVTCLGKGETLESWNAKKLAAMME